MEKKVGKTRVFYPRNPNQEKIFEAIEEKEDPFEELLDRLDMVRKTFSRNLNYLRENNVVEKHKSGDEILYRLVEDFTGPIETTLRHLDRETEKSLDLEKGKKLLTEEIAKILVKISKYKYIPSEGIFEKWEYTLVDSKGKPKPPSEQPENTIDELKFIKAIAYYSIEKEYLQNPEFRGQESKEKDDLLVEKLREKKNEPQHFPAVGILESKDCTSELEEKFDKLEEWIRPLSDGVGLARKYFDRETQNHLNSINEIMIKLVEKSG